MEPVAIFFSMRQTTFSFMHKQRGPVKYTESDYAAWISMYRAGKSFREISNETDVPFATIAWRLTTKLGIKDGRRPGRKKKYVGMSDAEVTRQWQLKRNYDTTPEEVDSMLVAQGGVCKLCGQPPRGSKRAGSRLHVDHNHKTGKVRALLCGNCNTGLGKFQDSPDLLEKAAEYVREYA